MIQSKDFWYDFVTSKQEALKKLNDFVKESGCRVISIDEKWTNNGGVGSLIQLWYEGGRA